MFPCVFVTFPYDVFGHIWFLFVRLKIAIFFPNSMKLEKMVVPQLKIGKETHGIWENDCVKSYLRKKHMELGERSVSKLN